MAKWFAVHSRTGFLDSHGFRLRSLPTQFLWFFLIGCATATPPTSRPCHQEVFPRAFAQIFFHSPFLIVSGVRIVFFSARLVLSLLNFRVLSLSFVIDLEFYVLELWLLVVLWLGFIFAFVWMEGLCDVRLMYLVGWMCCLLLIIP